jgi:hypothetical protein
VAKKRGKKSPKLTAAGGLPRLRIGEFMEVQSFNQWLTIGCVPMSSLLVPEWQRTHVYSSTAIAKMAQLFNPHVAGFLRVVPWIDGQWVVVDGGRRTSAMRMRWADQTIDGEAIGVPVQIIPLEDPNKASLLLNQLNENVKGLTSNDKFKTAYFADKPEEVWLVTQMKKIGVRFDFSRRRRQPNVCTCPGQMRVSYAELGPARCQRLIQLLDTYRRPFVIIGANASSVIEEQALRPDFIVGLSRLLQTTKIPFDDILKGLSNSISAGEIVNLAMAQASPGGEGRYLALLRALESAILHGLTV